MAVRIRSMVALLGALAVGACASLSPLALTKLVGLDLLAIEPQQMSIAAVMPVPLRLRTGDVVLDFVMEAPAPYGPVNERVLLEIVADEPAPGVSASPSFERIQTARVAAVDIGRLASAQAKARAFRDTGRRDGKGSISVSIIGGCRDGAINRGALSAEIYMRSKLEEKYFPLTASLVLRKMLGAQAIGKLPACREKQG